MTAVYIAAAEVTRPSLQPQAVCACLHCDLPQVHDPEYLRLFSTCRLDDERVRRIGFGASVIRSPVLVGDGARGQPQGGAFSTTTDLSMQG
jgi:hypothetical protein